MQRTDSIRHNWTQDEVLTLLSAPFNDLLFQAHTLHRQFHPANQVQLSKLMNIKSGGCPEDCAYCPQSAHYQTSVKAEKMATINDIITQAQQAKKEGATRFCMGAAWREPKQKDLDRVIDMIEAVNDLGMESCATLGMLDESQAQQLKQAGLKFYNHNLDTSPEYYTDIISTRDYQQRLDTLEYVRRAGLRVCCGGIIGMGEKESDRAGLLLSLANMPQHPQSVPINMLVRVAGTPAATVDDIDAIDFVRVIATARILMPASMVRLSAGRNEMTDEMQALCFFAGSNSIFYGEKLLTTNNPQLQQDRELLARLGIQAAQQQ